MASKKKSRHRHLETGRVAAPSDPGKSPPTMLGRLAERRWKWLAGPVEWTIFALACLTAVGLQIVLYHNSGAFWRDEASSIQVARGLSLHTDASWLVKDSAPPLLHVMLRLWWLIGLGTNDADIRLFGTLVFLAILVSLAISTTRLTGRAPLLATALVAFNPAVFYFGGSIRGYGLAILFVLGCCCAFWCMAKKPTYRNVSASTVLALLSCHASYQNTYLLFAIGTAGMTVCVACRLWKRCLLIGLICLATALSMLIYLPVIRGFADAAEITSYQVTFEMLLNGLCEALGNGNYASMALWGTVLSLAPTFLIVRIALARGSWRETPSLSLYTLMVLAVAISTACVFFRVNRMYPNPWHYAPLLALTGMLVDSGICLPDSTRLAWLAGWPTRVSVACLLLIANFYPQWTLAHVRRTNLDLVSAMVAEKADEEDLVLISPFWLSPGFKYYYHGKAPWNTLPLTSSDLDVSLFPYPQIKQLMTQANAMNATFEQVQKTLSAGRRVWIVGGIDLQPSDRLPPTLLPAPHSPFGWDNNAYTQVWSMQLGYFVRHHAIKGQVVPIDPGQPVNRLENCPLIMIEGWR